ncbi:MAG TPA: HEAT repeat domain-containing protein [Kofleriaceae bacterium]|nr:HEAT repeat domain-containing protein [Kofleriaceae bacterium]
MARRCAIGVLGAIGATLGLVAGCPASDGDHTTTAHGRHMTADHNNDWLVVPDGASSRELYQQFAGSGQRGADKARPALSDARPEVRRNAIVVLTAAIAADGVPDYLAALDDDDPFVASEAAAALASYGPASLSGPENPRAMAALRGHAAAIRDVLRSPNLTARYNAATALLAIVDPDVPLASLLGDEAALVRSVGLQLAGRRTLAAADVEALDRLARHDDDRQLRVRAVNIAGDRAPALAEPMIAAALARGDVDRTTSEIVSAHRMTTTIPAIVTLIATHRESGYFLLTLAALGATCALPAMADPALDPSYATDALRKLSGHPEWTLAQLRAWAAQQPGDAPPCTAK